MQRIIIAVLSLCIAAAVTAAIYLRWEVIERDSRIVVLERDTAAARKSAERAAANAVALKAELSVAKQEIRRLTAERDAALEASGTAASRAAAR